MTGVDDDRRLAVLPVTSARDGREHLVAEHMMTVGSAGRCVAGPVEAGSPQQVAMISQHDSAGQATRAGARPVPLARSRPGSTGQVAYPVHLIPLPLRSETANTLGALCGARLDADQIETVAPGEGAPCTLCLVIHISDSPTPLPTASPPDDPEPGPRAAATEYRSWGWPVTVRRDQIWLSLDAHAVALIIPTALATDVTAILATRHCLAPVLAHPHAPGHRIILGSEPYGVPLPWPPGVQKAIGSLLLPPTSTLVDR